MKFNSFLFLFLLFSVSCSKDDTPDPSLNADILGVRITPSPISQVDASASFYGNISYGSDTRNVMDFYAPESDSPTGLAIYIHGGGFATGDKRQFNDDASFGEFVNYLLSENIAFASINYRLLGFGETEGVLKSLGDSKQALQFIRFHADKFNINKEDIVLMGGSAGAGTSLWIGLQDDLADANSSDDIFKESTRVKGIVALETQSSYDVLEWHNSTFQEYQSQGLGYDELLDIVGVLTATIFYGVNTIEELDTDEIRADRARLDMLAHFSSDDPEMYVTNTSVDYTIPTNSDEVLHHPLHAKALLDKATANNVGCLANIPKMGIDNTNGESVAEFIVRKIGE